MKSRNIKKELKIIVATKSPRRIKILKKFLPKIKFISPRYKEKKFSFFLFPPLLSIYNAFKKVKSINLKSDIILGFDTIVFKGFKIYGKPKNDKEAIKFINELKNKTHKVVTGICIKINKQYKFDFSISKVKFKNLSRDEINQYIKTNDWKDKAGGYGIQSKGKNLIEWYKGDYLNIVGMPEKAKIILTKLIRKKF